MRHNPQYRPQLTPQLYNVSLYVRRPPRPWRARRRRRRRIGGGERQGVVVLGALALSERACPLHEGGAKAVTGERATLQAYTLTHALHPLARTTPPPDLEPISLGSPQAQPWERRWRATARCTSGARRRWWRWRTMRRVRHACCGYSQQQPLDTLFSGPGRRHVTR